MTYDELVAAIISYTENDSKTFIATIPSFVRTAEQFINNTVQLPAIRKNVTGTTTAEDNYITMPVDFLSVFSLAVVDNLGEYQYLLDKDVNFIRQAYPRKDILGIPKYYAIFNDKSFIVGPTPSEDFEMELHYFAYPESITTAGTSWLGDNFGTTLLYGSLVNAAVFMKGETDMIAEYKEQFNLSLALLKQLGDGKDRQDAYRSGQTRVEVQ